MSRRLLATVTVALSLVGLGLSASARAAGNAPRKEVTGQQIDEAAVTLGYGDARSPSGKYVAECMTRAGVPTEYDDSTGQYSFRGDQDGRVLLNCVSELAHVATVGR